MASATKFVVEAMNSSNAWAEITADVKNAYVFVGLGGAGAVIPSVGRCDLLLNNTAQTYNPGPSAALECRRRLRARASGASLGYALRITHAGAADAAYFTQTVTTAVAVSDVWTLTWEARAQFDSQYHKDKVNIVTSGETGAQTTYTYTNKWASYSLTFTATAIGTTIAPRFMRTAASGAGSNATVIEYRNISLKKGAGANVLVNGDFATGATSPWSGVAGGGGPITLAVVADSWIIFNGVVERVQPSPHINGGDKACRVLGMDFVEILRLQQNLNLALQKNKRGDELNAVVLAKLPSGTLNTTVPGTQQDTGKQTFPTAFDGYTNQKTSILDAVKDSTVSEYGRCWFDRDGTFRWAARDYLVKLIKSTPKMTLSDGMPFTMRVTRDIAALVNAVNLSWHPRQTIGATSVLAQITSPVVIPPLQADGVTPGKTTITLNFRDPSTQAPCGGDSVVTPLVATTDYQVFEFSDGSGVEYTSSPRFSITGVTVSASQVVLTLNNTATGSLYATKLQIRGKPVVTYDPQAISQTDAASIALYQERAWTKDLPFDADLNFATALGQYLLNRYANPFTEVVEVRTDFRAILGGVDVMSVELMDIISISDTQVGLSNVKHLVVGIEYQFTTDAADQIGSVRFLLERLDDMAYWILGDATYGVLDSTTRLFI